MVASEADGQLLAYRSDPSDLAAWSEVPPVTVADRTDIVLDVTLMPGAQGISAAVLTCPSAASTEDGGCAEGADVELLDLPDSADAWTSVVSVPVSPLGDYSPLVAAQNDGGWAWLTRARRAPGAPADAGVTSQLTQLDRSGEVVRQDVLEGGPVLVCPTSTSFEVVLRATQLDEGPEVHRPGSEEPGPPQYSYGVVSAGPDGRLSRSSSAVASVPMCDGAGEPSLVRPQGVSDWSAPLPSGEVESVVDGDSVDSGTPSAAGSPVIATGLDLAAPSFDLAAIWPTATGSATAALPTMDGTIARTSSAVGPSGRLYLLLLRQDYATDEVDAMVFVSG